MHHVRSRCVLFVPLITVLSASAQPKREPLPQVPKGFTVGLFAREPAIRNPASMCFDARGRLFVGQGPQFRHPRPDTPADSIVILTDTDGDGVADRVKTFATGFNCIQSLAWKGDALWVANAPDLTVLRDTDGDDEADEYVLLYTDLGNLEHGLHGLNGGPDGKLYLSKGNSKGLTRPGRIAPKPFRDLWSVKAPADAPDLPPPRTFTRDTYRKAYHDPADDWGREGGVLRCDPDGKNLEIVARGMRNPWDITFDAGFHWLGTDNDQTGGDKIFMPFFGAHFGWGHAWSSDWKGDNHLPTVPASGPFFEGSGTGIVHYHASQFPEKYRNVFFIDDWLRHTIYVYRPTWDGALMQPAAGKLEEFARAGQALFSPTDLEVGPDGALYVLGWGQAYGATLKAGRQTNEGRIFRIFHTARPLVPRSTWYPPHRDRPYKRWSFEELAADLGHQVPVWRVNAQDELVRRGPAVKADLLRLLERRNLSTAKETWAAWTLGRIALDDESIDRFFAERVAPRAGLSLNLRLQAIRILAHRIRHGAQQKLPASVITALKAREPRIRFEAVQAVWQARQRHALDALAELAAKETDRVTFYSAWGALRDLATQESLTARLRDGRAGVRRAALLALFDKQGLKAEQVLPFRLDADQATAEVASLWLAQHGRKAPPLLIIEPSGGDFMDTVGVKMKAGLDGTVVRYTLDGAEPTEQSSRYERPIELTRDATVRATLFRDGKRLGPVLSVRYHRLTDEELGDRLLVHDLRSGSQGVYRLAGDGLKKGARVYSDRAYVFREVAREIEGAAYVMTANVDAGSRGDRFLTFTALQDLSVLIAHDVRIRSKPRWMKVGEPGEFRDTGVTIASTDTTFRLYQKEFRAGPVVLGGNTDDGDQGGRSNYVLLVRPLGLKLRERPTTLAAVLSLIGKGDPRRGRAIFFNPAGVQCARCHGVDGRGNVFAPDLSDIGSRLDGKALVEAILDPNAIITEGFRAHVVVTREGKQYAGTVLEETGRTLTLVQADGRPVQIDKRRIEERHSIDQSAMPANLGHLLDAQQVADLAAFLLQRKKPPAPRRYSRSAPPRASWR